MNAHEEITRIARRVARHEATLVVGIFGSYAVGSAGTESDFDLFVTKDSAQRPSEPRLAMRLVLFRVLHPLDVHVFTPAEFEGSAYEILSFAWVIVHQARLYHWTEEAKQRVPSLFAHANLSRPGLSRSAN